MSQEISIDLLMPLEMAEKAEADGVRKVALSFWKFFALPFAGRGIYRLGSHVRSEHCFPHHFF
jgi:hypothetical protein